MRWLYESLKIISILAFLTYGLRVLLSDAMVEEFNRYGLARFRRLTGAVEVLGAIGLILGYFVPGLTVAAAGGLVLLMALGMAVRFRSGDSLAEALQALAMLLLNLIILVYALKFAGR